MSNYLYKNPLENNWIKINLTPTEHLDIFKSYKKSIKYEVYENETAFRRDIFTPLWVKTLNILAYPILLLFHGICNIKELNKELKELFVEKQCGYFYSEYVYKRNLIRTNVNFKNNFDDSGSRSKVR